MTWEGCSAVEIVPGIVSGAPIVRGSRVQADTVLESYELGESVEEIAYSFDLDPNDIEELLAFAVTRTPLKSTA